jgi:hypothetical protein
MLTVAGCGLELIDAVPSEVEGNRFEFELGFGTDTVSDARSFQVFCPRVSPDSVEELELELVL